MRKHFLLYLEIDDKLWKSISTVKQQQLTHLCDYQPEMVYTDNLKRRV